MTDPYPSRPHVAHAISVGLDASSFALDRVVSGPLYLKWRDEAVQNVLTALTDAGFLLLHEDDVTEEFVAAYGDGTIELRFRPPTPTRSRHHTHARLVTRWEPITNEDVGPWTTQETP